MNKETHQQARGVDEALRLYGDAMARIGQVEARVEELSKRLDAVVVLGATSEGEISTPGPDDDSTSKTEDELRHMRMQTTALSSKLAQTEDELKKLSKGKKGGRRRKHKSQTPWWKKLGRPFGINKPK